MLKLLRKLRENDIVLRVSKAEIKCWNKFEYFQHTGALLPHECVIVAHYVAYTIKRAKNLDNYRPKASFFFFKHIRVQSPFNPLPQPPNPTPTPYPAGISTLIQRWIYVRRSFPLRRINVQNIIDFESFFNVINPTLNQQWDSNVELTSACQCWILVYASTLGFPLNSRCKADVHLTWNQHHHFNITPGLGNCSPDQYHYQKTVQTLFLRV